MKQHYAIQAAAAATALSLLFGFQAARADGIRPLNSVAVEVNAGIITYGDIERSARSLRNNPANKDIPDAQIVQAAKNSLIERALLADAARQQGLRAGNADIDAELVRRARAGKTSVEALYQQARAAGFSRNQFRIETAKDIVIERMMNEINDNARVSDAMLNNYLTSTNPPAGAPYTVYTIRRILLNADSQANMEAVGRRMNQIAQAIRQGTDFAGVARRYSQEPQAANGGLHQVSDGMLPTAVENVLHQLQPGQVGIPVQAGRSWQLIQLVGVRTESDPAQTRRETARRLLQRQEQQKAQQQFLGQLQQGAVIREY